MALDIICPHCKKKVIESYRIINPYMYGSKIQICKKCGGEIFDNRWREVAIQGFDPIQDTEKKYTSWFGAGLVIMALLLMNRDFNNIPLGNEEKECLGMFRDRLKEVLEESPQLGKIQRYQIDILCKNVDRYYSALIT